MQSEGLRVHAPGGTLLVPIHWYPAMGGATAPARVDMGVVRLGERARRAFKLENKALPPRCHAARARSRSCLTRLAAPQTPLPFDFRFSLEGGSPDISLSPMAGAAAPRALAGLLASRARRRHNRTDGVPGGHGRVRSDRAAVRRGCVRDGDERVQRRAH